MVPWLRTVLLLACVAPHQGEPCAGSPLPYSGLSAANQHPMRAKMPRLDELFAVQRKMADGQKATFVVIGGSMTGGHGLCNGGAKACPEEAWPGKLEPLLGRVRVVVRANPATSSSWAVASLGALLPGRHCPEVIVLDYGVNDAATKYQHFTSSNQGALPGVEALTREVRLRCPDAALFHIEGSWNEDLQAKSNRHRVGSPTLATAQRKVADHYGAILVSHISATCYQPTEWHEPHPPATTHAKLAREFAKAWHTLDALRISTNASAARRRPWVAPSRLDAHSAELSPCALAVESEDANTGRGTFRLVRNASAWSFYEDAPGKPGFIAAVDVNATAPDYADATASFRLDFPRAYERSLMITYLTTYENAGRVRMWVGKDEANGVTLDALSKARYSIVQAVTFKHGKGRQWKDGVCDEDVKDPDVVRLRTQLKRVDKKSMTWEKTCQIARRFKYLELPPGAAVVNFRLEPLDKQHRLFCPRVNKFKLVSIQSCDGSGGG